MTINEPDNTITATRDELTTLIDKTLDRKIKALPDRSAIAALGKSPKSSTQGTQLEMFPTKNLNNWMPNTDRDAILKTFRFFNAVSQNDHSTLRAIQQSYEPEYVRSLVPQAEGTSSAGGYLVPPEFYADVLFMLNEFGFARKHCGQIQMRSNVLNVSTLTGKPSVAWTAENGVIPASKATFGRL